MRYDFYRYPWFDKWLGFSGAIPEIYWNVYSNEQRYKFLCKRIQGLVEYASKMGTELNVQGDAIEELAQELADMSETFAEDFADYYKATICEWVNDHLDCIVGNAVRFVQFGLTDDGRLIATIPNNWDFLQFKTNMDADSEEFGKLQIVY